MKKLNLEKLKLAAEDVLQRSQMTTIYGGSGGGSGTCGVKLSNGEPFCGMTYSEAYSVFQNNPGSNWCCDSCQSNGGSASYC